MYPHKSCGSSPSSHILRVLPPMFSPPRPSHDGCSASIPKTLSLPFFLLPPTPNSWEGFPAAAGSGNLSEVVAAPAARAGKAQSSVALCALLVAQQPQGLRLDVAPGQLRTPSSPASHLYWTSKSCSRMSMRPSGGKANPAASSQVPVTRSTGIRQGSGAHHCSGGQHRNPALCPQQPHVHPAFAFPSASRAQECRNLATVRPPARGVTAAATGTRSQRLHQLPESG